MSSREHESIPVMQKAQPDYDADLRAAGELLPAPLDAEMSARFGVSFGDVRVHRDAVADKAARQAGAQAFTYGNHIAFAAGHYSPFASGGRELIAHELAHVLQ